jgi:hypothetical protein
MSDSSTWGFQEWSSTSASRGDEQGMASASAA